MQGRPNYFLPVRIQWLAVQLLLECMGNNHCSDTERKMLIGGIIWTNKRNGKGEVHKSFEDVEF
jgi:hypothetical protein